MTTRAIHEARRKLSFQVAPSGLTFTEIDRKAQAEFIQSWSTHPARTVKWDWVGAATRYAHRWWGRLDLAIWSGPHLCGLALGKFSRSGNVLAVDLVEGAPFLHPLKKRTLLTVAKYGQQLGVAYRASMIRFTYPAPHVIQALKRFGYSYVTSSKKSPYYDRCERSLP